MRRKHSILTAAGCTLAIVLATSPAFAGIYDGWRSKAKLRFQGFTGGEAVVDFPVVVKLTPARTQQYADFSDKGADLRFATADEKTALAYEIERWDEMGDSFIWVNVPRIAKADDFIWMYWNNRTARDAQDSAAVWPDSAGYVGVWHLNSPNADGKYIDSAHPNRAAATPHGTPAQIIGPVGTALHFNGTDDFLDSHNTRQLSRWTVATWVRSPEPPGPTIPCGPVHRRTNYELNWGHNSYPDLRSGVGFRAKGNRRWYPADFDFDEPLHEDTWYYLAGTYDGINLLAAYRNGKLVAENLAAHGTPETGSYTMKIARHAELGNFFCGDVDEVQVLDVAKSAVWVAMQYKSMTDTLIAYPGDRQSASTRPAIQSDANPVCRPSAQVNGVSEMAFSEGGKSNAR